MRLLNIYRETISDGPGLRYAIYLSGCSHACPGCHNPRSWNPNEGVLLTPGILGEIIAQIKSNPLLDGITISGGDPFFIPSELYALLKELKQQTGHNIWCYTGYTIEFISKRKDMLQCLEYIDMLVDGPFIQSLHDLNLSWRGSSNQRIIAHPLAVAQQLLATRRHG